MKNVYTNEVEFRFDPVKTFGYNNRQKYAAGILCYDEKGNAIFNYNSYSYCNYIDLLGFLKNSFGTEYSYRNVSVNFYGKNTRCCKVGRTYIEVSAEDKININGEYFIPDLILALNIIKLYDSIKAYGFNKRFCFQNKTSKQIIDFFEIKFAIYELYKESIKEQNRIPAAAACWKQYLHDIKNTYSQWEYDHSHCESSNDYGYEDNDKPIFNDVDYVFPVTFKVVTKIGTLITEKYHREYDILEVKAIDPYHQISFLKPNFIVYVPKDRDMYSKIYTNPDFEKYSRKDSEFESILEAASNYICGYLCEELKKGETYNAKQFLNNCKHCERLGELSSPFKYSYEHSPINIKNVLKYNDEYTCKTWGLSLYKITSYWN